jgi:rod shape-determining protein MreB
MQDTDEITITSLLSISAAVAECLNLSISSFTAERLKREIGSAETLVIEKALEVEGRDINTGLLKIVRIPSRQIEKAIKDSVGEIVEVIKNTFTDAPPEICSDIIKNGIYLTGGGAQLQNLDNLIAQKLNIKTYIVKRPEKSTIFGIKKIIENEEKYYDVMHIRR